jgi:hypothetical protein
MQESNLRCQKGGPDRGTVAGNAGKLPQDLSLCSDRKGPGERGQSTRPNRTAGQARTSGQEVPMIITRLRVRGALAIAIALLPLILGACNNGGSSGY